MSDQEKGGGRRSDKGGWKEGKREGGQGYTKHWEVNTARPYHLQGPWFNPQDQKQINKCKSKYKINQFSDVYTFLLKFLFV